MEETPKVWQPKTDDQSDTVIRDEKPSKAHEFNKTPDYSVNEASAVGRQLAENMDELGYHPVVIFGSSYSGKSSLLGSLLAYFQVDTNKEVGISLGEPLVPTGTEQGREAMARAEAFFYRSIQEFIAGEAHQATKLPFPFFIPVVIRPKGKPEMRFAFMESAGEWYQPQKETDRFFQSLKSEIEGVLRHYQKGISFIHVAPYTQSPVRDGDISPDLERSKIRDASLALVGALDSYTRVRTFKDNDNHMFLVTKWDAKWDHNSNERLEDILANPNLGDVEKHATEKYAQGFSAFKGLPLETNQKSIMQYCSGLINNRVITKPGDEMSPILYRYPQTMWNWLYRNASGGVTLIPKPIPPKETAWQIVMKWINKVVS